MIEQPNERRNAWIEPRIELAGTAADDRIRLFLRLEGTGVGRKEVLS